MVLALVVCLTFWSLLTGNAWATVAAVPPYTAKVFAQGTSSYNSPDSISFTSSNVFVGFGNGVAKDGKDGKSSTIAEYDMQGKVVQTFSVLGHNDGLRVDPRGDIWALQNEDGNPNLVIIDVEDGKQKTYTFAPTAHGGGYDDIVFAHDLVFFSASNPSKNPNTDPAVVSVKLKGDDVEVAQVLAGNTLATDVTTGSKVTLNLQDPDSMILDPSGEFVLTSQADMELVVVAHPDLACQTVFRVPLTTADSDKPMADDTVFVRSGSGMILFSDKNTNTIYSITAPYFAPGAAYTAAQNSAGTLGFVGQLNLTTGLVTPIVSGLGNPGGMAFISNDAELNDPKTLASQIEECP
jgi:hypothetical protein